jgi:UDP-GlcNAc:undecaprenyl-phosphate GlcNAc-1-phosphate transferase
MYWVTFLLAFSISLVLVIFIRWLETRVGFLDQPRHDRWHDRPTPHLGGIGIFFSFAAAIFFTLDLDQMPWGILIAAGTAFGLGLFDDIRYLSPQGKLVGLFLASFVVIAFGNITAFFPWWFANILISFIWVVGIANALNLLDNMDGLAGGTALIVSGFLAYLFWKMGNDVFFTLSIAIVGSVLGFWLFNFPPASIFMGDSGSLFLGLTLASLAIAREPQASNVFAIIGIPTLIFLLPILDTVLVSITRLLRGLSPFQGGRDHTSHRLVALGLNERQTVLVLMSVAFISGLAAILLEAYSYFLSLVLIPVVVLIFALVTAYLGQMKIVEVSDAERKEWNVLTNWLVDLTYRRRVLEVLLDFFIFAFSYYLAFVIHVGLPLDKTQTSTLLRTIPIVIAVSFSAFYFFGIYRGVWEYLSLRDGFRYIKAAVSSSIFSAVIIWLVFGLSVDTISILFVYLLLLLLLLLGSRFSFRFFDQLFESSSNQLVMPVIIYGAGDAGELALRECQQNKPLGYKPIGFLDDEPLKKGRSIHGLEILGGLVHLEEIINQYDFEGMIISSNSISESGAVKKAVEICNRHGIWVRKLKLDFIPIENTQNE